MDAYNRRSYSGDAPDTTLVSDIDDSTLTVTVTDATGWPDGTNGPFCVIFEPEETNEEKCWASARSGNTITLLARGMEGTAAAHKGTTTVVRHGFSALDADEANYAVSQTVGQIAAKGDLLVGSAANTLTTISAGTAGQAPTWQADGSLAADNPTPAAHTHAESDVTDLTGDIAAKLDAPTVDGTANQVLALNSDATALEYVDPPGHPDVQIFDTSGSHTWTKPTGAVFVDVIVIGAGAGGSGFSGSAGGKGGGGGGLSKNRFSADDLSATVAVTVGAGGAGASSGTGDSGGASSFGTLVTAGGGGASVGGTGDIAGGDPGTGGNSTTGGSAASVAGAPTGGGGGAGVSGVTSFNGGSGGLVTHSGPIGGTGATSTADATAGTFLSSVGPGSGGGGGSSYAAHANGADGVHGGGGGGGGAVTGAVGGDGGGGVVAVISW